MSFGRVRGYEEKGYSRDVQSIHDVHQPGIIALGHCIYVLVFEIGQVVDRIWIAHLRTENILEITSVTWQFYPRRVYFFSIGSLLNSNHV